MKYRIYHMAKDCNSTFEKVQFSITCIRTGVV